MKRVGDELARKVNAWIYNLDIEYGLTSRFSLMLSLNYAFKSRSFRALAGDGSALKFKASSKGVGDTFVLGKIQVLPWDVASQREFDIGIGARFPTGAYDLTDNGVRVSRDLQPGSGANHLMLWSYYYQSFRPKPVGVSLILFYTHPDLSEDGYRFGDELSYIAGILYQTSSVYDLLVQIRGRWAGRDAYDSRKLPSTGGTWLYVQPGVNIRFFRYSSFYVLLQLPVYRNVNGAQLSPSAGFRVGSYLGLDT